MNLYEFWNRATGKKTQRDMEQGFSVTTNHLVALARLLFIKPDVWVREANNVKANAEYILQMSEAKEEKKA